MALSNTDLSSLQKDNVAPQQWLDLDSVNDTMVTNITQRLALGYKLAEDNFKAVS